MKTFLIRNKQNIIYIITGIILFVCFVLSFIWPMKNENIESLENNDIEEGETIEKSITKEKTEDKNIKLLVDIKGEIASPGVFEMEKDQRVIDVIKKAGDLTKEADTSMINLSQKVKDEMVIIIYSKKEVKDMDKKEECNCPSNNDACIDKQDKVTINKDKKEENDKIYLNSASVEELMTLEGIGQSKALEIIKHREETPFTKIEDIKEVNGIGEAIYEKIKDRLAI